MLGDVNKLFNFKSLLTMHRNFLPFHLKQTFPPIIWIFTEGEGDGIKFRLPFKIFSALTQTSILTNCLLPNSFFLYKFTIFFYNCSAFDSNLFSRETKSERIERKFKNTKSKPISSELLSSDPDKSSVELSLDCKAGFEGNFGALFSLPYSIRPDFDSTLKNIYWLFLRSTKYRYHK